EWGKAALDCRAPHNREPLAAIRARDAVRARGELGRRRDDSLARNDRIVTRNGDGKRSIVFDPLPRRAQTAEVERVRAGKGAGGGRPELAVGLRDVAALSHD